MTKILLHIGYPRTATTWLQTHVFPFVQNYSFLDRKIVRDLLIHPSASNYDAKKLKNFMKDEALIISEEMITGRFRGGDINLLFLKEMLHRVRAAFSKVEVVILLRNQQEIIYSLYNLYIRKGGTYSLKDFIDQSIVLKTQLLMGREFLEYDKVISLIKSVFGDKSTHIFLYEKLAENPERFLKEFSEPLNLNFSVQDVKFIKLNKGYSPFQLTTKRFLNHFTMHGIPFKKNLFHIPFLYRVLINRGSSATSIAKSNMEILNKFCEYYKQSNANLLNIPGLEGISKYDYLLP